MNAYQQDINGILQNLMQYIDNATSANELHPFIEIMPLDLIKQCIKQRIIELHNVATSSPNNTNSIYSPICSAQYNEMRKYALSISPITDILSADIIIHTLSFLTTKPLPISIESYDDEEDYDCDYFCDEKAFVRYLQFLPTLSKAFKSIMNHSYFYGAKYPLIIHDTDYKPINKPDIPNFDPNPVHIYAAHWVSKLEIIRCQYNVRPNTMDSSLPWRNRTKVIIECNMLHFKTANPNISSVLTQINPKLMYIRGYAPELRLKTYPTFRNVVFLSVNDLNFRNMECLNVATFPSLKILKMRIPFHITSAKQFNVGLNSLNLYALHLTDNHSNALTKLDLTISMPELQFLAFGSDLNEMRAAARFDIDAAEPVQTSFLKTLDLSKCVSLLGIHFFMKVPFSSIVWNKEYPLKFVNVTVDERLEKQDASYCAEWYNAYENGAICSDMVIGHCFFKTAAEVYRWRFLPRKHGIATRFSAFVENEEENNERERCKKRRSMDFDELVEYIGNKSNIGWCQFTENALLSEAYFVKQIAKNVPRKKDDDDRYRW